jgi:hypothetical protein
MGIIGGSEGEGPGRRPVTRDSVIIINPRNVVCFRYIITTTTTNNNNNLVQFLFMNVLSQQPNGKLQEKHNMQTQQEQ